MNVVTYSMISYVDVFGLAIFDRIVRDLKRRFTVSKERNRTNC